jgi:hypothetical protein
MTYTPHKPPMAESPDELRKRIPGWGVDLDPKDRPSVPKLQFQEDFTGAHWEFPERQPEKYPRERSVEHGMLTPVFGTAQPPSGVSGVIRRYAYRYSEGRAAHWLLLIVADRVDAWEHHLRSFLTLRPDNPITETGVKAEFTHHGLRRGSGSTAPTSSTSGSTGDRRWPVVAAAGAVYAGARSVARSLAHAGSDGQRPVH